MNESLQRMILNQICGGLCLVKSAEGFNPHWLSDDDLVKLRANAGQIVTVLADLQARLAQEQHNRANPDDRN